MHDRGDASRAGSGLSGRAALALLADPEDACRPSDLDPPGRPDSSAEGRSRGALEHLDFRKPADGLPPRKGGLVRCRIPASTPGRMRSRAGAQTRTRPRRTTLPAKAGIEARDCFRQGHGSSRMTLALRAVFEADMRMGQDFRETGIIPDPPAAPRLSRAKARRSPARRVRRMNLPDLHRHGIMTPRPFPFPADRKSRFTLPGLPAIRAASCGADTLGGRAAS